MSEQHQGFAPIDPSADDDLLTPDHERRARDHEVTGGTSAEPTGESPVDEGGLEDTESERPRTPHRPFVRFAWTALVVFAVIGVLLVAELVRVTSALNNSACIQKAQTQFMQTIGPGVSAQFAGLDRLTAVRQLAKCDK